MYFYINKLKQNIMSNFKIKIEIEEVEFRCEGDYEKAIPSQSYLDEPQGEEFDLQEVYHKSENIIQFLDNSVICTLETECKKELGLEY